MTTLTPGTDIPTSASATVEKLAFWALSVLNNLYASNQVSLRLSDGSSATESQITMSHFTDRSGIRRGTFVVYFEMDPAYDYDHSVQLWARVKEMGTVPLPTGFKSN